MRVEDIPPLQVREHLKSIDMEMSRLQYRDEAGDDPLTEGEREHLNRLNVRWHKLVARQEELNERSRKRDAIGRGEHTRTYGLPDAPSNPYLTSTRDSALAAIEHVAGSVEMRSEAVDRLDTLVRENDYTGSEARYIAAVSSDDYRVAFGKMLAHPFDAHFRMTPQEAEAVRTVAQVSQERAMNEGLGTSGAFGVPTFVDPTLMLDSNRAINPIRQLARVETINTNKWQGVAGVVTATFAAELAEVDDGSPTLAGPTIDVEKAHAFVPYSVELEGDYEGLTRELGRALADAKDVLEAQVFLDGLAISNEPVGIISTAGALTTAQRIQTTTTATTGIPDVYALKEALPARWLPQGTFTVHPTVLDVFRRYVGGGSTEPPVVENGQILNGRRRSGRRWRRRRR